MLERTEQTTCLRISLVPAGVPLLKHLAAKRSIGWVNYLGAQNSE